MLTIVSRLDDESLVSDSIGTTWLLHGAGPPCAKSSLLPQREKRIHGERALCDVPQIISKVRSSSILGSLGTLPVELTRNTNTMRAIATNLGSFCAEQFGRVSQTEGFIERVNFVSGMRLSEAFDSILNQSLNVDITNYNVGDNEKASSFPSDVRRERTYTVALPGRTSQGAATLRSWYGECRRYGESSYCCCFL
jgi:hypothetical protein